MITFQEWRNNKTPEKPSHKNKQGAFDPQSKHDEQVRKKVDLIVLPSSVKGTNCLNCGFAKKSDSHTAFCENKKILQWVTDRMCCAYWDNPGVKRSWGKMDEKSVTK